jgi:Carboxypeptidase regulatory-like domain
MMTLKLQTLAVATLAAALSGCGGSSSPPTTPTPALGRWTISGVITDVAAQIPVAGARIEVVDGVNLGRTATADGQGRYQIATLEPGAFTVRAWADEFEPQTRAVTLAANQSSTLRSGAWAAGSPARPSMP